MLSTKVYERNRGIKYFVYKHILEKYLERVLSLKKNEIKKLNFYNKFDVFPKNFKSLGFNYGLEKGLIKTVLWYLKNYDWCQNIFKKGNYRLERLGK